MTDSIRVFDPGYRVTDQNGAVVPGALIKFFDAGTTTPKTVYSNSGLSVGLGSIVTCDAYGAPASGSVGVLIYTGIAAYRVQIYTSGGVLIPGMDFDNIKGALDTSGYNTVATVVWPVVPVSATGSVPTMARLENTNPTAGQIIRTLPTAASTGNGNYLFVKHDGTSNATLYASQGSDLIHMRGDLGARQTLVLFEKGDAALLISDGVDYHAEFTPEIDRCKFFVVKAIQTAPPSSPVAGDAYIITGTPTGAWSAFAADDVVTSDGNAGWIRSRPSTDCGWVAYVVSSQTYYRYVRSGWLSELATGTTYGTVTIATQAEQEASTSLIAAVTPARQQYHPSACKAWIIFDGTGTVAIKASYNIASLTDNGLGDYTVAFTTAFSSAFYAVTGYARATGAGTPNIVTGSSITAPAAGSCRITVYNTNTANLVDSSYVCAMFFGDQ